MAYRCRPSQLTARPAALPARSRPAASSDLSTARSGPRQARILPAPTRNHEQNRTSLPARYLQQCVPGYTDLEYRLTTEPAQVESKLRKRYIAIARNPYSQPARAEQPVYRDVAQAAARDRLQLKPAPEEKIACHGLVMDSGYASHKGGRSHQEDACSSQYLSYKTGAMDHKVSLYAVYDGHGSAACSKRLVELMPRLIRIRLREYMRRFKDPRLAYFNALKIAATDAHFTLIAEGLGRHAGSTGTIVLREGNNLWVACTGDSPALLMDPAGKFIPLTEDALPTNPEYRRSVEKRRLITSPDDLGCQRVHSPASPSGINMARAFGDGDCASGLSARPKIVHTVLQRSRPGGYTLVIGSDGLFESSSRKQVGNLAHTLHLQNRQPTEIASILVDTSEAAFRRTLTKEQQESILSDNTSALVAFF